MLLTVTPFYAILHKQQNYNACVLPKVMSHNLKAPKSDDS